MSFDLSDLLRDWPYEPGQLQVRKITGSDGREKLQLRLDMGVLQMEMAGRPDGREPHGVESELEFQMDRAEQGGKDFELSEDDVGELQAEGVQYYHRYLALFQLGDWQSVIRDTKRNLDMFAFVAKHAPDEEAAWGVLQFRPYVMMMNTRAKANLAIEKDDVDAAIKLVEKGIVGIEKFVKDHNREGEADTSEIKSLSDWLGELRTLKPLTPVEKLNRELERAVEDEKYERAAELRDALKAMQKKS
ncbi:MAG: UvrB/UvrC motif-containing protein [Chthoniobacteraceae bacterium]